MSDQLIMSPHAVMGPELINPESRNRKAMSDQELVRGHYPDAKCITRESRERSVSYCVISEKCVERNEFGVVRGVGVWCMTEEKAWFDAAQRLRHMPADYTIWEEAKPQTAIGHDVLWGSNV